MGADKNGVSPNSISLPKGPGSIEGLGDSFQPTLNTGTAKYGLGIKVPPGTAGHQPSLSLSYDGGGANGPLGYGWNISLPYIQRRIDEGIPTYGESLGVNRSDTFITESREELVPTSDGFFFCENEASFVRYQWVSDHWQATAPNGSRLEFGITDAGRIQDGSGQRVFRWLLERETDTRGNVIEYFYRAFPGGQNLNQKYLAEVRYGPALPRAAFHFVAFDYEDRPDWFDDGRAGFLVRTGKRLRSIRVATQGVPLTNHLAGDFNADGTSDHLNRRYDLDYLRYNGGASHWSLLARVTVFGADGVTTLPPATFDYAVSNPPGTVDASSNIWTSSNAPIAVMDNALVDLVDLNADGLPDLLKTGAGGGGHTVAVNRGPARHGTHWTIQWADAASVDPGAGTSWNFDLGSDQTHLADMNGDGLADLVHKAGDDSLFYFANLGKLNWGARQDMALQESAPPAPFGNPTVRIADIDFDKRMDVIQSINLGGSVAYRIWFNLGHQTYSAPATVEPEGGFDFALPGVQVVDWNGDRVPDIARIQPGAVTVAAGLGYGRFAAPVSLVLPDFTLDDDQVAKARLTEINGDGLPDLVLERSAPGVCWYWLNLGNYTFDARRVITGLPTVSSGSAVRWADLNGNGTTDLIYADSTAEARLQMVELGQLLSGGLSPNLLTRIGNGIGRMTTIEYAPSTQFALADAAANRPWPDSLPFPVTVVSAVIVSDSLGHEYVTRFRYHDGYYEPLEKQFRGFAEVEQIDVGDASAPTLVSRSHFDTGKFFDAMKGRVLQTSAETEDGGVFTRETTTWADPPRVVLIGTNGLPIRFAHPVATAREILEGGAGLARRVETEMEYDRYGNTTRLSEFGIVENGDRSAFDDERITVTEFAHNLTNWIVRLPKRQFTQDENGVVISRSELFYDDESFAGNNLGNVTIGNLTMRRDWFDPSSAGAYVESLRTRYDTHGNPIGMLDPLADASGAPANGHVRELEYDPELFTFPERETIHVGGGSAPLVCSATFDSGLATAIKSIDFNGHVTSYGFDALGRVTSLVKPGDTAAFPTAEYEYALAVPTPVVVGGVLQTGVVNYVESRTLDRAPGSGGKRDHYFISRQFTDGLGRALMSRMEAEPDEGSSAPRVVVSGVVLFNARVKPERALNPFFTLKSGSLDELLAFENIEAPGWQGRFHLDGNVVSLSLTNAHQTTRRYDATLRLVQSINPDGTFARQEYAPLLTREFDEHDTLPGSAHFNTPSVAFTDGLGRLVRLDEVVRLNDDGTPSTETTTWSTRYQYDINDRLTRITDAQDNVKELRYDGLQRKVWMNDPDAGISSNRYDAASNVIETTDAKGQRITYTYDGANRTLTEDYHDENSSEFSYHRSPDVAYHYDAPAGAVDQGNGARATPRNVKGLLAWVEDASGREHTSFDARGRVEWTVKQISDPALAPDLRFRPDTAVSYRTGFEYDSIDRITRLVYPDNDEIGYRYNARSLPEAITGGPGGNIVSGTSYLPSAQQQRLDYGNGVRTSYDYDARQRLNRLLTRHAVQGNELVHFAYELDPVSNINAIHDQRPTAAVPLNHPRRNSQRFTYDSANRLTRAQYNLPHTTNANGGEIHYRYDRIGNLLEQRSDIAHVDRFLSATDLGPMTYGGAAGRSGRVGRQPQDPPGPHALTGLHGSSTNRAYSYDANGNMTSIDGMRCTWDFKDRLVAAEDDAMRAEYRYDFSGRRVIKRVTWKNDPASSSSAKARFTWALYPDEHFEVRDAEQPTKYVFNGSTRVAHVTGSLSSNQRIQRLRLHAGPNLVSLAVTATNLVGQLTAAGPATTSVQRVSRWVAATDSYTPVTPGETVPAGAVLWIRSATNAVVSVQGSYVEPASQQMAPGGKYLACATLEAWTPPPSAAASFWAFSSSGRYWLAQLPAALLPLSELPAHLPPGQPLYMSSDEAVALEMPEPALRIRYYHQDHLGSSAVMTDATGAVIEETAFFPSGMPRHEYRLRSVEEHYAFSQKERDRESGLHYFEARYLAARLARFTTTDPKYASPDALSGSDFASFLSRPQEHNLYAYALNNPLRYNDPTGLDAKETVSKTSDGIGIAAGATDELSLLFYARGGNVPGALGTAANVAGKATAGLSVLIKGYDLVKNPNSGTAGQFLNEGAKTLVGLAAPPVGLVWSILDLSGYGPSAILEATEASIQANRKATILYYQTTAVYDGMTQMINERAPKIAAQQRHAGERLKVLKQETAKWQQQSQRKLKGDTRTLEQLNAENARLERVNKRLEAQAKYWEAKAKALNAK